MQICLGTDAFLFQNFFLHTTTDIIQNINNKQHFFLLIIFPSEKDRDFCFLTYSSAYSLQNQQWSVQSCPQISHFYLLVTPFPAFILANKRCTHWKYTGFDFMTFKLEMFKGMKNTVRSILFCENSKGNKLLTSVRVSANLP